MIRSTQLTLSDNSQHSQEKNIHASGGILNHNPINERRQTDQLECRDTGTGNDVCKRTQITVTANFALSSRAGSVQIPSEQTCSEISQTYTMYKDKIKQINFFYEKAIFLLEFSLFTSEGSLVLPCSRRVRKRNFDVSFINRTFVIQLIISNRQQTYTVCKCRLPFWHIRFKYIFG